MASIKLNGKEYPLVPAPEMTLREQRFLKHMSGHSMATFDEGMSNLDPDLITAWLLVCVRREKPDAPDDYLDDLELEPMLDALSGAMETVEDEDVPLDDAEPTSDSSSQKRGKAAGSGRRSTPKPSA